MIGRLHGMLVSEAPDGMLVVDVGGVGYEVLVPLGTTGRCPRGEDGAVTLMVVTHVREDAITLYGFASETERATFRMLTAIAGVGPRIAVGILGALPSHELAAAVARGDVKKLQSVPGVGRKIADRLALELKDKIASGALTTVGGTGAGAGMSVPMVTSRLAPVPVGPMGPLVATLMNLGFKPMDAERAAAELGPRAGEPLDVLVREALRMLVR